MSDLPETHGDPTGRRSLLKKAAVGAAAAWVAPVIISGTASAGPGTPPVDGPEITPSPVDVLRCDNVTKDPTTLGTGGGGDPLIPYPAGTTAGDLILVSASANESTPVTFAVTTNSVSPLPFTQLYNVANTGGVVTSLWSLTIPPTNPGSGVLVTFSSLDTPVPVTIAALRVTGSSGLGGTFTTNQSTVGGTTATAPAMAVSPGALAINITATELGAAPFTPKAGWVDNGNASLNGSGSGCGNNRPDLSFQSRLDGTDASSTSWGTSRVWSSMTFEALPLP